MNRADQIVVHPVWKESVCRIEELERERKFCHHDVTHFLDVARLAWIENLEQHLEIPQAEIYAAAMLHDIGRHLQYEKGIPHDQGSVMLSEGILKDCGFTDEERSRILQAIGGHRDRDTAVQQDLGGLIYRADKRSRMCLLCSAEKECNWSAEKKNLHLK